MKTTSELKLESFKPLFNFLKWVIIIWLLLDILIFVLLKYIIHFPQFGDVFSGVNSLFSGFAFVGVIYTMYLQKQELELQRQELELTRKELTRSADAQEQTQEALNQQVHLQFLTARLNSLNTLMDYSVKKGELFYNKNKAKSDVFYKAGDEYATEIKTLLEEIREYKLFFK